MFAKEVDVGYRKRRKEVSQKKRAGTVRGQVSSLPISSLTTKTNREYGFVGERRDKYRIVELVEMNPGFCVVTRETGIKLASSVFCNKLDTAVAVIQGYRSDAKCSGWSVVNLSKV